MSNSIWRNNSQETRELPECFNNVWADRSTSIPRVWLPDQSNTVLGDINDQGSWRWTWKQVWLWKLHLEIYSILWKKTNVEDEENISQKAFKEYWSNQLQRVGLSRWWAEFRLVQPVASQCILHLAKQKKCMIWNIFLWWRYNYLCKEVWTFFILKTRASC